MHSHHSILAMSCVPQRAFVAPRLIPYDGTTLYGCLTLGSASQLTYDRTAHPEASPSMSGHAGMPGPMEGVVATILLQIPFIKHIFGWIGAHPAGARARLLRHTCKHHSHMTLVCSTLLLNAN